MPRATRTGRLPKLKYLTERRHGIHESISNNMVDDDDEMYANDPEEQVDTQIEDTREKDRVVTQDNPEITETNSESDENANQETEVEVVNDQSTEVDEESVQEEP